MYLRFPLSLLLLWCLSFPVAAQTVAEPESRLPTAPAVSKGNSDPLLADPPLIPSRATRTSTEFKTVMQLFQKGLYSEVIDKTTALLEKADTDGNHAADPAWKYFRGYALRRRSLFDQAKQDLQPLGNFAASYVKGSSAKWAPASTIVEKLDAILAARPPLQHLVHDKGQVRYRVFYNQDDEFSQTVIAALTSGYAAASKFTKVQATEIPVFVFNRDEYPQFAKFYTAQTESQPRPWFRVLVRSGAIYISQRDQGSKIVPADPSLLGHLVSHETTHVLMGRILGRVKDFPDWFNEGSAESGEAVYDPTMHARNDRRMKTLLRTGTILPLSQIISVENFRDAIDHQKDGTGKSDAYAQGFSMTRYLGTLLKGQTISDFATSIREKESFEAALKEATGLSSEEFYASWLEALNTL
jgi:hypothetical protein